MDISIWIVRMHIDSFLGSSRLARIKSFGPIHVETLWHHKDHNDAIQE